MKKLIFPMAVAAAICILIFAFCESGAREHTGKNAYLRVHIRANSNDAVDQAVKYRVRDKVVEFLTPTVSACATKEAAEQKLGEKLQEIAAVAERVLRENGFSYGARAALRRETFPTRVYEDVTLEAGVYDALILELGEGKGDNWWCVVYPPLCFSGGNGNIVYKSRIAEIVKNFFGRE